MKMSQLFTMEDGIKQNILVEQNIDADGNIVMVSGKVVSINLSTQNKKKGFKWIDKSHIFKC